MCVCVNKVCVFAYVYVCFCVSKKCVCVCVWHFITTPPHNTTNIQHIQNTYTTHTQRYTTHTQKFTNISIYLVH